MSWSREERPVSAGFGVRAPPGISDTFGACVLDPKTGHLAALTKGSGFGHKTLSVDSSMKHN